MMRLTYIWHDCFLYEDEKTAMVFDFWKDPMRKHPEEVSISPYSLPIFLQTLDSEKPLYVFVSHHHKDHYVREIFEWSKYFPSIRYILSKDTAKFSRHIISPTSTYAGEKPRPETVTVLKPGESYEDSFVTVEAFDSTDIGNSYVVKRGERIIFHAGDLNAWIWKDESTEEEVCSAIAQFKKILDNIAQKHPILDIAMFPVDSRIGRDFFTGASIIVHKMDVRHFFPMHFGLGTMDEQRKYQMDAADVERYANPERGEYICLQAPYSTFMMP